MAKFFCNGSQLYFNPMKVLDGNKEAAELLAAVVHSDISLQLETELASQIPELPIDNLGIWIDPIGRLISLFCSI